MQKNTLNYLLFLFSPLFALATVLKDFRSINIANFFLIFLAFIGASLYPYGDAERYRDRFYEMHDKEMSYDNFKDSLLDGETSWDIAVPTISYLIASFTRNEKILFTIFGLILGFFYGKNIQYILNKLDKKNANFFIVFLVIIFSMIVTFWDGIRGVRMWTAAHIFFYAVSRIIENRELKHYQYFILACAYHFSFLLPVIIFFVYLFLPKRYLLLLSFVFFILTIFISGSNFDVIKQFVLNNSPDFFQLKVEVYTADSFVEKIKTKSVDFELHRAVYDLAIKYSFYYLLIISYLTNRLVLNQNNNYYNFFSFAFIIFGVANILSVLPSGGRFISVALMFSIIPVYYGYINSKKRYFYHITILPLLFWLIVTIRTGFYSLTLGSVFGNPFVIFFDFATEQNLDSLIK
jgi:hypothetical protein